MHEGPPDGIPLRVPSLDELGDALGAAATVLRANAAAAGLDERFDGRELDMIESSADGFGEHLYDDGVCKPAVSAPAGADRQARILARLGRRSRADVA